MILSVFTKIPLNSFSYFEYVKVPCPSLLNTSISVVNSYTFICFLIPATIYSALSTYNTVLTACSSESSSTLKDHSNIWFVRKSWWKIICGIFPGLQILRRRWLSYIFSEGDFIHTEKKSDTEIQSLINTLINVSNDHLCHSKSGMNNKCSPEKLWI